MATSILPSLQLVSLILGVSTGLLLALLWRRNPNRLARDTARFHFAFLAIMAADFAKTWIQTFAIGVPPGSAFSFAAYPDSFGWYFPLLLALSPITAALIGPAFLPLLDSAFGLRVKRSLVLCQWAASAAATLIAVVLTIHLGAEAPSGAALFQSPESVALGWAGRILIYLPIVAQGFAAAWRLRGLEDRDLRRGAGAFLLAAAILLPGMILENALWWYRSTLPLARRWFAFAGSGLKPEWGLFSAWTLVVGLRALSHLSRPAPAAPRHTDTAARERLFRERALSPREAEIAALALEGMPNKDIASHLGISPATVKNHLSNAYRKLGVTSRWEMLGL